MSQTRISEDGLDQMFETTRTQPQENSLVQRDELIAHLREVDSGDSTPNGGGNRNIRPYLKPVIMTTFICGIIGFLLLLPGETTHQKSPDRNISDHNELTKERLITPLPDAGEEELNGGRLDRSTSTSPSLQNDGDVPRGKSLPPVSPTITPALVLEDLTPEELEEIFGIRNVPEGVAVRTSTVVSATDLDPSQRSTLSALGVDMNGEVLNVGSDYLYNVMSDEGEVSSPNGKGPYGAPRALVAVSVTGEKFSNLWTTSALEGVENMGSSSARLPEELVRYIEYGIRGEVDPERGSENSIIPALIAVRHPVEITTKKGEKYVRVLTAWYMPTEDLIDGLPERYRTDVHEWSLAQAVMRAGKLWNDGVSVTYNVDNSSKNLFPGTFVLRTQGILDGQAQSVPTFNDIPGIRYVDLTNREAERLGILRTDSGLAATMLDLKRTSENRGALIELGYPMTDSTAIVGFGLRVAEHDGDWKALPAHLVQPDMISPIFYSGTWVAVDSGSGRTSRINTLLMASGPVNPRDGSVRQDSLRDAIYNTFDITFSDTEKDGIAGAEEIMSRLVPVRTYLDDDPTSASAVFWYLPTEDFLDRIPERYRREIGQEVELIASAANGGGGLCDRIAGDRSFLGICREQSGALAETSVSPNPASTADEVGISFRLKEPRTIRITLHDLSGRFIAELSPFTSYPAGIHKVYRSLEKTGSGAYLISIESDEGDRGVQRIVVGG